MLPNLYCHSFTTRGSITGGDTLVLANEATTADTNHAPVGVTGKTGLGFDVITLNEQFTRYRIVSYGARVRTTAGLNATGEFTCAVMALKGQSPTLATRPASIIDGQNFSRTFPSYYGSYGPRQTTGRLLQSLGLPSTSTDNAALLDLPKLTNTPCHAVASAAQVATRGLHMRGLPYEAQCRDYVSTAFNAYGTDSMDVGSLIGGAGSASAIQQLGVDMSFARVAGNESLVVGGTGFTASATIGTIEVIYHVEAMTNPNYALLVRPTGLAPTTAGSQTIDQVLTSLHKVPRISFADVVQTAGDAMLGEIEGRAGAAMGGAVSGLAGMLGRMMTAAL